MIFNDARSAHWRSSRKITSGCSRRASVRTKPSRARFVRFCASTAGRSCGRGKSPTNEFDSRNDAGKRVAVWSEGLRQAFPPPVKIRGTCGEQLGYEATKGLCQRGVGSIPVELVALPGDEEPALADDGSLDFVHQCRFPDARTTCNKQ